MGESEWSDSDDAELTHWSLPDGHPSRVVKEFFDLVSEDQMDVDALTNLVTPESQTTWGSFSAARGFAEEGYAISNRTLRFPGADDVVAVKLVDDNGAMTSEVHIQARAYATLVWRPSRGGWRIHGIGGQYLPDELPRELQSGAPRYETDVTVTI